MSLPDPSIPSSSGRITVVGSNMMDLVTYVDRLPGPGETIDGLSFEMGHGGKGANQACAAARLGSTVLFVSRVGNDAFADATLGNLRSNGIDARYVTRTEDHPSGVATILVEPSGENRIVIVKGANARLGVDDLADARDDLAGSRIVLLQLEIELETVYRTIEMASDLGVATLLNPAPAAVLDISRLKGLTFLVPNQHELAILTERPTRTIDDVRDAARRLIDAGIETIVVTLGRDGALLVTAERSLHVPSAPVTPVDTTGAGDAFIGAFAHFFASGTRVEDGLRQAARYAALSVTRRGAQKSYPTPAEFAAFA